MKCLYRETMEQVKMSDVCSDRIQNDLIQLCEKNKARPRNKIITMKVAVAAFITIIGLSTTTAVIYASNGKVFQYLYTFFSGGGINYEESENGESKSSVIIDSEQQPPIEIVDDKMYFIADGSHLDITDKISESNSFIGEYIDKQNITHKFIVGGKVKDNYYGYVEYIFDQDGIMLGGSGWFGNKISLEDEPEWLLNGKVIIGIND